MFLKGSLTCIGILYIQIVTAQFKDISKLLDDLQKGYKKHVLPTRKANSYVAVKAYPAIVRIDDLDANKEELSSTISLSLYWTDDRLAWQPIDYGNVRQVYMPASNIWLPDISVYNTLSPPEPFRDQLVEVSSLGRVLYVRNVHARSYCHVDLTWFPRDEHTCELIFSSWIYPSKKMLMEFMHVNTSTTDIPVLADTDPNIINLDSHQWQIRARKARAEIKLITYACCSDESYIQLKIAVTIKRNTSLIKYLTDMFIFPMLVITILVPFLFLLPSKSSSRSTFGLMLLFGHMLCLITQCLQLPSYSDIPVTGIINLVSIAHAMCALVVSIVTSQIYTNNEHLPALLLKCMKKEQPQCKDISKRQNKLHKENNSENESEGIENNNAETDALFNSVENNETTRRLTDTNNQPNGLTSCAKDIVKEFKVIHALTFLDKVLFIVFLVLTVIIVISQLVILML